MKLSICLLFAAMIFAACLTTSTTASIFSSNRYNVIDFEPARLDTQGTMEIIIRNDRSDKASITLDNTDTVFLMLPSCFSHDRTRQCFADHPVTCTWALNDEKTQQQVTTEFIPAPTAIEGPVISFACQPNQPAVVMAHHDLLKIRCENVCTPISLQAPLVNNAATPTTPGSTTTTPTDDQSLTKYGIVIIETNATEPILETELSIVDNFKAQDSERRFIISIAGDGSHGLSVETPPPTVAPPATTGTTTPTSTTPNDLHKDINVLDSITSRDQRYRVEVVCEYLEKLFRVKNCRLESISGKNVMVFSLHDKHVRTLNDLLDRYNRGDHEDTAMLETLTREYKRQQLGPAAAHLSNDEIDDNDSVDLSQMPVPPFDPNTRRMRAFVRFLDDLLSFKNSQVTLHQQTIPN